MQQKEAKNANEKAIQSKAISKSDHFKVLRLILKKGATIKEHSTDVPAFLLVQKGQITLNYQRESIQLSAGAYTTIRASEIHWVIAQKDSEFLLVK